MRKIKFNESVVFDNTFFDGTCGEATNPVNTGDFSVVQAVDSRYFQRLAIKDHRQWFDIELTAVIDGDIDHFVDGTKCTLHKGECALTFRGEVHALSSRNTCRFLATAFDVSDTSPYFSFIAQLKAKYGKQKFSKTHDFLKIIQTAIREFYIFDTYTPMYLNALFGEVLILLLRGENALPKSPEPRQEPGDLLAVATGYMDTHAEELITVREVADFVKLSYSTFFRLFKSCYGISPVAYLKELKIRRACDLLASGDLSVTAIAERLGYSSPYNFSRAFRENIGVSPSAWKREQTPADS